MSLLTSEQGLNPRVPVVPWSGLSQLPVLRAANYPLAPAGTLQRVSLGLHISTGAALAHLPHASFGFQVLAL